MESFSILGRDTVNIVIHRLLESIEVFVFKLQIHLSHLQIIPNRIL